jgi:hypothetical protein
MRRLEQQRQDHRMKEDSKSNPEEKAPALESPPNAAKDTHGILFVLL